MAVDPRPPISQSDDQLRYARWLEWGARAGLWALVVLFLGYAAGWFAPGLPIEQLPRFWGLPVSEYLAATGAPSGWQWLESWHDSDSASLLGIALLAGCSVPALLALIPAALRRRDGLLVILCAAEVCIILLAASGLMSTGH